jgi:omega-amidase
MKVACCQLNIVWEDKAANYARVRNLVESAKLERGTLLVLPEMFATGFSMRVPAVREGSPSETEAFLKSLAKELGICVFAGVVHASKFDRGSNEAVAFDPNGNLLVKYAKMHPFTLGGESAHYSAGDDVLSFTWQGAKIAPFICYDLRFPEIFRVAALRGAEVLVVIASWPIKREDHWVTLLRARAIENQAFVIGVNRSGTDPQFVYPGRTLIVDPHGVILVDAGREEKLITADLDISEVARWRAEFPVLADIRPEFVKK